MHIDSLEKKWIYVSTIMAFTFIGVLAAYAVGSNVHPPSNVETIDSVSLHLSEEFNEDNLGVKANADGSYQVTMVAARYGFYPQRITLPQDTPITFRIASADVLHGVHGAYTNMSTMVVPGYVSEVNTAFPKTGEFPLFCNEYCGIGHDYMWSRMHIVPKDEFKL